MSLLLLFPQTATQITGSATGVATVFGSLTKPKPLTNVNAAFSDNFNRADGAPGGAWQIYGGAGSYTISSNRLVSNAPGTWSMLYVTATGDRTVQATMNTGTGFARAVTLGATGDPSSTGYGVWFNGVSWNFYIQGNGVVPTTGVASGTTSAGDHIVAITISNGTLSWSIDGVVQGTKVDASWASTLGTRDGLSCANAINASWDDFSTTPASTSGTNGKATASGNLIKPKFLTNLSAGNIDSFNRADNASTLGTTSDGTKTWSYALGPFSSGNWSISSNAAVAPNAANGAIAYFDVGTVNVDVKCKVSNFGGAYAGIIVRSDGTWNSGTFFLNNALHIWANGSSVRLFSCASGVQSSALHTSGGISSGDEIRLKVIDTTAEIYVNGVSRGTCTVPAPGSYTNVGMENAGGAAGMTFDDFSSAPANNAGTNGVSTISATMLRLKPLTNGPAGQTTMTDAFNRANSGSTLGSTDTGQSWQVPSGAVAGISSNQAYGVGNTSNLRFPALLDTGYNDGIITMKVVDTGQVGIVFRAQNLNNNTSMSLYYLWYNGLYKYTAGSAALIASWPSGNLNAGDVIKAEFVGNSIKGYRNGSLDINVADSSFPTGTLHGMMLDPSSLQRADDFSYTSPLRGTNGVSVVSVTLKRTVGLDATKVMPTLDVASTAKVDGVSANSISWSHTCASGAKALVVALGTNGSDSGTTLPTSVTYGGTAMTYVGGRTPGTVGGETLWVLKNPPAGTATIQANYSVTQGYFIMAVAASFFNAAGTMGSLVNGFLANFNAQTVLSPSSGNGDLIIGAAYYRGTYTFGGSGQTQIGNITSASSPAEVMFKKNGGPGVTVSLAADSNGEFVAAALIGQYAIQGASTVTATLTYKKFLAATVAGVATVTTALGRRFALSNLTAGSPSNVGSVGGPNSLSFGPGAFTYDFTPSADRLVDRIDFGIVAVTPGAAWYRIGLASTAVHDGAHSPSNVPWLTGADSSPAYVDINPASPNSAQTLIGNLPSRVSLTGGVAVAIVVIPGTTQGADGANNSGSLSSGTSATYSGLTGGGPIRYGSTFTSTLSTQYAPHFTLYQNNMVAGTNGVATLTGNLVKYQQLAGSSTGSATTSDSLRLLRKLQSPVTGVATASVTPSRLTGMSAGTNGVATLLSSLKETRTLIAISTGVTVTTSSIKLTRVLTTTVAGTSTAGVGTIRLTRTLTSNTAGFAAVTGNLPVARYLIGSVAGSAVVTPDLSRIRVVQLAANAVGLSGATSSAFPVTRRLATIVVGLATSRASRIFVIPPADYPVINPTLAVAGHIYGINGSGVSGATVKLFRVADDFMCQQTTSAGDGSYSFVRDTNDPYLYYVVAYTTVGATQIHGTSDRDLAPV